MTTKPKTRTKLCLGSKPALSALVRYLRTLGYNKRDSERMVLRAFKWKIAGERWISPYNPNISFSTDEALRATGEPFFLIDTAAGRFDGIT